MKAAIPIWIAFVPSSLAWGIAAQAHGLTLEEVIFMSAWVYSGPAQFAVLGPLTEGKSSIQVLVAGFLMKRRHRHACRHDCSVGAFPAGLIVPAHFLAFKK